jgi:hypothetical protein
MLVSNEDFMPNKPTNKNLIDQMKKKITSKDALPDNQSRSRSKTITANNCSLHYSTDVINAGRPVNFQASNHPQISHSIHLSQTRSMRSAKDKVEEQGSFISYSKDPNNPKNKEIKDLTGFEKDDLPNIKESNISGALSNSKLSKNSEVERYYTNRIYKSKLQEKAKVKNLLLKEMTSSEMDNVSSEYTYQSKDSHDQENSFTDYLLGFVCGFFLSIFGVMIMLFCTNKKRRCEGATHGMILSSIVLIVLFNGYFFNVIKSIQNGEIDLFQENHHHNMDLHFKINGSIGTTERDMINFGNSVNGHSSSDRLLV